MNPEARKMKQVSQHQRDERARRMAMGVAVIQRPLKQIRRMTVSPSSLYKAAQIEADNGRGYMVTQIARHALNGGM